MSEPRILVAGIGNIFMGDDAFGVEVVRQLASRPLPEYVRVVDFGIRGLHLAYTLMEGYDTAILVDAVGRGEDPGTLFVLEPDISAPDSQGAPMMDAHSMNPMRVLATVQAMGGRPKKVLLVGCEPATLGDEFEGAMGMSPVVESAVGPAVAMIESLIAKAGQEWGRPAACGGLAGRLAS